MAVVVGVAMVTTTVVGVAMVTTTAVGEVMVVGGHQRSPVGSSPVHWLLRIMPLPILLRIMRRTMHRHRTMGRVGGEPPPNLISPKHKLSPAGSEPFSHGETETETRVTRVPQSWAFGSVGRFRSPATRLAGGGSGSDPPVPLAKPVGLSGGTGSAAEAKRAVSKASSILRGTEGSNPASSSAESSANLIFGEESHLR